MIFAPSGWGKSRLLGRRICYQDACRGIGQVVIDVIGGTIDNLLDKTLYLPRMDQLEVGERLRYCNMAGLPKKDKDRRDVCVTLWPVLTPRDPKEPLDTTAKRIIELIGKTDRNLSQASIQGMNRLEPLLTSIGIVLTALREPLSLVFDLLDNPNAWQGRLSQAATHPEAREAVTTLRTHFSLPQRQQAERTEVLRNKLSLLRFDRASRLMFSGDTPTIDWEEVAHKGLTVLIDLRGRQPERTLEFKLFWVWNSLLEYIATRNRNDPPLGLVIDELTFFVRGTNLNTNQITKDFSELIQARKRNANLWLTLATQEQRELPEGMLTAVLSMGNQLYGATTDDETAEYRARRFDVLDPYKVKHTSLHWGIVPLTTSGTVDQYTPRTYGVTGESKTFMSLEDQKYQESWKFKKLPKGDWFFGQTHIEGDVPRHLRRITTRNLDPGQYVNTQRVTALKRRLMLRDGVKVEETISELDGSSETAREKSSQDELLNENAEEEKIKSTLKDRAREPLTQNRPRRTGRRRYVEPV